MSGPTPRQIAALAAEIQRRRGAQVRSAHQDSPHRFRIECEDRRGRFDLVLDLDPTYPRIHLAERQQAPASPTPLASILRRNLRVARFEGARAVRGERAVVLAFRRGGGVTTLWFEAFGRRANLYLVGTDERVVMTPRGDVAKTRRASVGQRFEPVPPAAALAGGAPPTTDGAGARVEAEARSQTGKESLARRRAAVLRQCRREVKRAEGRIRNLEQLRGAPEDAARLQREAKLLQASFHLLRPGVDHVRVPDHAEEGAPEVEIQVDGRLAPGEQIARAFHKAQKAERAAAEAEARLPAARTALNEARQALAAAESASDLETLDAIHPAPAAPARRREPPRAQPWREFRSADGWRILVGKDARGNEILTTREARPQDLWLHARGVPGSHVVVPTPQGKTVPKDTLLDAAQLAALFSARKDAATCEVDYTPRRYVSRARGAAPGEVRLQRSQTLCVRREEERRTRLRASRHK